MTVQPKTHVQSCHIIPSAGDAPGVVSPAKAMKTEKHLSHCRSCPEVRKKTDKEIPTARRHKDPVDFAISLSKGPPPAFNRPKALQSLEKQLVQYGLFDFEVNSGLVPSTLHCLTKPQALRILSRLSPNLHSLLDEAALQTFQLGSNPQKNGEQLLRMKKAALLGLLLQVQSALAQNIDNQDDKKGRSAREVLAEPGLPMNASASDAKQEECVISSSKCSQRNFSVKKQEKQRAGSLTAIRLKGSLENEGGDARSVRFETIASSHPEECSRIVTSQAHLVEKIFFQ